ncbi:hypothetical protein COB64_03275 [Candidatus Wolfebacteria bacterium]|nr:MAG: hypothetical protein COB64_03275 [Candidatus Wolfebacteria bacterium]
MNNKGFTLLEFLIYIGLVSIILIVFGAIALNVFSSEAKLSAIEEVSQNARFTMEKIATSVRNAEVINNPDQDMSASSLSLQMADTVQNPTIFNLLDGVVTITEGIGSPVNVTSSEVNVSELIFSNLSYSATPGTVRIQMTVKLVNPDNRQEYKVERTYFTTANIRKN